MIPQHKFRLLPNYYKKVGLIIIVLSVIIFLILAIFKIHLGENINYYRDFLLNGVILGMYIIAFSKEKVEDERVRDFRYKSLAVVLVFGLIFTVLHAPIYFFLFHDEYRILSAQQVMMTIMSIYLMSFAAIRHEEKGKEE